jgi:hypothetical protein
MVAQTSSKAMVAENALMEKERLMFHIPIANRGPRCA